jgi:chorismate dehydratase
MTVKIGLINYLNTQPFHYDLATRLEPYDVDFVRGVPTQLNQALLNGEIDLAPVSAYFVAQHASEFVVLPGHGISSHGAVRTVLLFSWRPDIHELDGAPVALTDHSATSVALLKVLCRNRYDITPRFVTMTQNLPAMMQQCSAALVIGDTALVEGYLHRELPRQDFSYGRPTIFDLGDEWLKLAGLTFTFAVWAARRGAIKDILALGIPQALAASKAAGLANLSAIAANYAPTLEVPVGVCTRYLRDLRYDFKPTDQDGLMAFLKLALPDFRPEELRFLEAITPWIYE